MELTSGENRRIEEWNLTLKAKMNENKNAANALI
jgi:hypothetical protein